MSTPKTAEEIAEEKLRKCNAKLSDMKALFKDQVTMESTTAGLASSEQRISESKGHAKFIEFCGSRLRGSDKLEAQLQQEVHLEHLLKLHKSRSPHEEMMRLLQKKSHLVRDLLRLRSKKKKAS